MKYEGFSINLYDSDGDVYDKGVFISMDSLSLRFNDPKEVEEFAKSILKSMPELQETWDYNNS